MYCYQPVRKLPGHSLLTTYYLALPCYIKILITALVGIVEKLSTCHTRAPAFCLYAGRISAWCQLCKRQTQMEHQRRYCTMWRGLGFTAGSVMVWCLHITIAALIWYRRLIYWKISKTGVCSEIILICHIYFFVFNVGLPGALPPFANRPYSMLIWCSRLSSHNILNQCMLVMNYPRV